MTLDVNTDVEDTYGLTALGLAYAMKNDEIIQLLDARSKHLITDEEANADQQAFFLKLNDPIVESTPTTPLAPTISTTSTTSTLLPGLRQPSTQGFDESRGYGVASSSGALRQGFQPSHKASAGTAGLKAWSPAHGEEQSVSNHEGQVEGQATSSTTSPSSVQAQQEVTRANTYAIASTSTTTTTSTTSVAPISSTAGIATSTKKPTKATIPSKKQQSTKLAHENTQYLLLMHEKFKWPKSLNEKQQGIMLNQLRQLKKWPNTTSLDIKELKGQGPNVYRMRIGGHRIIFSVDEKSCEIKIQDIGLRKNIYKIGLKK